MTQALYKVERLCKTFNPGRTNQVRALDDVSVDIREHSRTVVFGPSGSGKTTLLTLLGTLDRPSEGTILFRGRDLNTLSEPELTRIRRNHFGFVFQTFQLIQRLSAWENVSYPLIPTGASTTTRFNRAAALLERLGMGDRLQHTPEELSGGEQQRVAIARALINNPEVIIADEPTSNIDEDSTARLLALFVQLHAEGRTIVVSSHDAVFRTWGDARILMERGRASVPES